MIIWRMPSNTVILSYHHVSSSFDPQFSFDWDCCFNCGGNLLIEIGGGGLGHDKAICPICDGVGETLVARPEITYYDYIKDAPRDPSIFFFPDEQFNWHP